MEFPCCPSRWSPDWPGLRKTAGWDRKSATGWDSVSISQGSWEPVDVEGTWVTKEMLWSPKPHLIPWGALWSWSHKVMSIHIRVASSHEDLWPPRRRTEVGTLAAGHPAGHWLPGACLPGWAPLRFAHGPALKFLFPYCKKNMLSFRRVVHASSRGKHPHVASTAFATFRDVTSTAFATFRDVTSHHGMSGRQILAVCPSPWAGHGLPLSPVVATSTLHPQGPTAPEMQSPWQERAFSSKVFRRARGDPTHKSIAYNHSSFLPFLFCFDSILDLSPPDFQEHQ